MRLHATLFASSHDSSRGRRLTLSRVDFYPHGHGNAITPLRSSAASAVRIAPLISKKQTPEREAHEGDQEYSPLPVSVPQAFVNYADSVLDPLSLLHWLAASRSQPETPELR